jgi:DNA-3-methyladenine glycosylase I
MKAAYLPPDPRPRCAWCLKDDLYVAYHDAEWGVPLRDSRDLFAKLMLDGFQAGLSWHIVLKKRAHILAAFDQFDPERVAGYGEARIEALAADPQIIRNRAKIRAAVRNAQAFLRLEAEAGSFSDFLWQFTGGRSLINPIPNARGPFPATSPESDAMSKALRQRGFQFVGSTICYAFMQAVGMVNDHWDGCWRKEGEGG